MGVNVAVVGLNFGSQFVPVYRAHPGVGEIVVADLDADLAARQLEHGADRIVPDLDAVLADDSIDAVHILTPPHLHAPMSIRVLEAGKHCASAIPAGIEMAHLHELVRLQESSGRNYMMMETATYYPPALEARQLLAEGAFGTVTFARGVHYQDMSSIPAWQGFPPFHNPTHAIGPLLTLLGTRATSVRCLGSGRLPDEMQVRWGNPFPVETAIFELEGTPVAMEVTRAHSHFSRGNIEGFSLYGDRLGYEFTLFDRDPIRFVSGPGVGIPPAESAPPPDFSHLLPEPLRPFGSAANGWEQAPYWGALAHLVHELISSIQQGRRPLMDAVRGADMTGAGLAAHASAMSGGAIVEVPDFRRTAD